ncbi:MAG: class I SAM-dependent rRNA methyltransferase [Elusimicrobia bacterium]|nr:class I SAM-dependent rRNA methyltransferase [Elusimicrobiota bacterium]
MNYPQIVLKPAEERRIIGAQGHPWIFSNEIAEFSPQAEAPIVAAYSRSGKFIGLALYNPNSLIVGRVLARSEIKIDVDFWTKRLGAAWVLRQRWYPESTMFRWIFGESDQCPGLIIDRYGDYCVMEILSKALESQLPQILEALLGVFPAKGVLLKRDNGLRKLEGLELGPPKILSGQVPKQPFEAPMDGLVFLVDPWEGQKTGFYLDQRDNRAFLRPLAAGKRVLDCYAYTGAFGLTLAKAGALEVICIDSSERAADICAQQAKRNNLSERIKIIHADAESCLASGADKFDLVLIDPPNLAPNKKSVGAAGRKLEKITALAMELVDKDGFLAVSICSHHISLDTCLETLRQAARKSQKAFRIVTVRSQAQDHPVLLQMPETQYLKFILLERA